MGEKSLKSLPLKFWPMSTHTYNFESFSLSYISVIVIMPVTCKNKFEHRLKKSAAVKKLIIKKIDVKL